MTGRPKRNVEHLTNIHRLKNSFKAVYINTKISIILDLLVTSNILIEVNQDLHQGCGLSLLFVASYLNKLLEIWISIHSEVFIRVSISILLFADDDVLLTEVEDKK